MSRGASAIAITPAARPSTATNTAVRPVAASSSRRAASAPRSTSSSAISFRLPTTTRCPSTVATAPCPATFRNPVADSRSAPRSSAYRTTAAASGCSDSRSTAAASASSSGSSMPSATTSVTSGSPLVRVPVLSITTVSIRAEVSSAVAFLNSTPRWAPSPVPTMIAVGVARPERVGAGDHHDGDREQQRGLHPGADGQPDRERQAAADQRDQHQPERGPVGQPLPGGLGVLRLLHQGDDLRQRGVRADLGGPDPQRAGDVDRRADHLRAGRLGHRQALAGDHRLVDLGLARPRRPRRPGSSTRAGPAAGHPTWTSAVGTSTSCPSRSTTAFGGASSSRVRMASLAPPRARISNQCPSSTNAVSTVAAS